jgi:hypothetical protein
VTLICVYSGRLCRLHFFLPLFVRLSICCSATDRNLSAGGDVCSGSNASVELSWHVGFTPDFGRMVATQELTLPANQRHGHECFRWPTRRAIPLPREDCSLGLGGFGDDHTGHARERRAFVFAPTGLRQPVVGFLLAVGLPLAGHDQKFP